VALRGDPVATAPRGAVASPPFSVAATSALSGGAQALRVFSASGGLVYQGLIPGRDEDLTALAVYYGKFSDRLENQNAETVVEANYRLQLAPWLYVTPDFQYVIRPNGQSDIDDAAVFGGEIGIDF
jgi:carbohydrate-selective porin OprB